MARKIPSIDETTKALTPEVVAANSGTTAQTFAGGADTRITGAAQKSANLSDLADAAAARTNLGLGTAATRAANPVQQITLTGDLALTIPEGLPADEVASFVLTQDGTGGHTVTYDDVPVTVSLAAGAVTTVEFRPAGAGYLIRYPDGGSTYQRRERGTRTIVIGDSIDEAVNGWFPLAAALSGQRILAVGNAGIGGNTTAQMLARIHADVIAKAPDVCIIGGPTNDINGGTPEATTRANIAAMVAGLRAAGITPALRNCPPCDTAASSPPWNTVAAMRAQITRHNAWLRNYAQREGLALLDIWTPMVDPLTGGFVAGYTADGVHPLAAGRQAAARHVVANLPALFRDAPRHPLASSLADGENLFADGLFSSDTDSDGFSDGWELPDRFASKSRTTDANAVGWWQNCDSGAVFGFMNKNVLGLVPGHVVELTLKLATIANGNVSAWIKFQEPDWTELTWHYAAQEIEAGVTKADQAVFRVEVVVPPTADRAGIQVLSAPGGSSFAVAQVMVRDLTALGIA